MTPVDTTIGLFGLALYVVAMLALSAAVTWLVVKISPAQSAKEAKEKAAD